MMPINERRLKRCFVNPSLLMDYLRAMEHWPRCFGRAIIEDDRLPSDAALCDVRFDDCRRCLVVVVSHASFDEVPAGDEIPILAGGYANIRQAWFVRSDDGSYRSTDDRQQAFAAIGHDGISPVAKRPLEAGDAEENSGDWFRRVMSQPAD